MLQLLVEDNHHVLDYPIWPNTADYVDTTETFGIVPIHSAQLGEKLRTITLEPALVKKFTSEVPVPLHGDAGAAAFRVRRGRV